ncbi:hypothetical protein D3C81_764060 [compost metagenome]
MLLQVTLKDQVGRRKSDTPGRGGRQVAHIDGIKVAPGWQHVQASTTRGAARAGRDEAPLQGGQHPLQLSWTTGVQLWRNGVLQGRQYSTNL